MIIFEKSNKLAPLHVQIGPCDPMSLGPGRIYDFRFQPVLYGPATRSTASLVARMAARPEGTSYSWERGWRLRLGEHTRTQDWRKKRGARDPS